MPVLATAIVTRQVGPMLVKVRGGPTYTVDPSDSEIEQHRAAAMAYVREQGLPRDVPWHMAAMPGDSDKYVFVMGGPS